MNIYKQLSLFLFTISIISIQVQCMENFHTIEGYRSLSDAAKRSLAQEATTVLKIKPIPPIDPTGSHPLLEREMLSTLVGFASGINTRFSKARIYSLGQSPAYLVQTADFLHQMDGKSRDLVFGKIAFSGHWKAYSDIREDDIDSYKRYLGSIGMHPFEIINEFELKKIKTIIYECVKSRRGLECFLEFLEKWANDFGVFSKLKDSIDILTFEIKPRSDILEDNLIYRLANADDYNDRLVERYPHHRWSTSNLLKFRLSRNAKLCLFQILDFLAQKQEEKQ
jgi:hypothetical protein